MGEKKAKNDKKLGGKEEGQGRRDPCQGTSGQF